MQEKNSTVEKMQDRNCQLQKTVDSMQEKNSTLEKKLSEKGEDGSNVLPLNSSSADVSGMKENLLELLASCESFQKGFDKMAERQTELENKLKTVTTNYEKTRWLRDRQNLRTN